MNGKLLYSFSRFNENTPGSCKCVSIFISSKPAWSYKYVFDIGMNLGPHILLSWPFALGPVSQLAKQSNMVTRKIAFGLTWKEIAFCSLLLSTPTELQAGGVKHRTPAFLMSFTPCNLKLLFLQESLSILDNYKQIWDDTEVSEVFKFLQVFELC